VETYAPTGSAYNIYVVEPSQGQILRYEPNLDQSSYREPQGYLLTESEEVSSFRQLHIDRDLWALDDEGVQKYASGRYEGAFRIGETPDATDLRPGHDYQLISGIGNDSSGRLYLYDSVWDRLVVFDKVTGSYVGQWVPGPDGPSMEDMRAFFIQPRARQQPETAAWVTPEGLFTAELRVPSTRDPDATEKPSRRDRRGRGGRSG
jgi:hypothetical protein